MLTKAQSLKGKSGASDHVRSKAGEKTRHSRARGSRVRNHAFARSAPREFPLSVIRFPFREFKTKNNCFAA